jgi:hypothetical protein
LSASSSKRYRLGGNSLIINPLREPMFRDLEQHSRLFGCPDRGVIVHRLTVTEIYLNLSPEEGLREFREKW